MRIEKNIPIPKDKGQTLIIKKMEVGDSVLLPNAQKAHSFSVIARSHWGKYSVTMRTLENGTARVWRVK